MSAAETQVRQIADELRNDSAVYAADAHDLDHLATLIRAECWDKAEKYEWELDTRIREMVPFAIWEFIRKKNGAA